MYGVTIHFIDATFCLRGYLFDVKELLDNHTGDNIAEHLSEIMNDWHLSSIILSGVTMDHKSNMLKAVDTLHWLVSMLGIWFFWSTQSN